MVVLRRNDLPTVKLCAAPAMERPFRCAGSMAGPTLNRPGIRGHRTVVVLTLPMTAHRDQVQEARCQRLH